LVTHAATMHGNPPRTASGSYKIWAFAPWSRFIRSCSTLTWPVNSCETCLSAPARHLTPKLYVAPLLAIMVLDASARPCRAAKRTSHRESPVPPHPCELALSLLAVTDSRSAVRTVAPTVSSLFPDRWLALLSFGRLMWTPWIWMMTCSGWQAGEMEFGATDALRSRSPASWTS
jgi:hypothetical protein